VACIDHPWRRTRRPQRRRASLVPADEEVARELADRGDGFLVESTTRDIERDLSPSVDWDQIARDIDKERDRDTGWSW
jgi:hypothetical protein